MEFWKMAWKYKWVTLEEMKMITITDENPWGRITQEEFKEITGQEYKK